LIASGIDKGRIQVYNFEDLETSKDFLEVYSTIKSQLVRGQQNYIFLDEIQNVSSFEKLVDGLFVLDDVDLYITGSNAFLLSGELATYLSGRYIEINMLPLSFSEYLKLANNDYREETNFANFCKNGGFPQSVELFKANKQLGVDYLRSIYNTIMIKDVLSRNDSDDALALRSITRFLANNIGSFVSPYRIAEYMRANNHKIDQRKVERIIDAVCDSYIFYPVERFNLKDKELLKTQQKFYLVDLGLRRVLFGAEEEIDTGHEIENLVFLELLRRGYEVYVGQTKNGREVDFMAKNPSGGVEYYQVAASVRGAETLERELQALREIDDNNPKFLLTGDAGERNYAGILQRNVLEWLGRS